MQYWGMTLNHIHRARDDSGQNEAERSNACIGESIVDGGALKWKYHEALDNSLGNKDFKNLSIDELNKLEENAMERNAWWVAKDVTEQIQGELGPAGDLCTPSSHLKEKANFFSILNSSSSLYQQQNLNKMTYQALPS